MSQKLAANRPSTSGTLPPIVTSSTPAVVSLQRGRSFDKTIQHIGQEQLYSQRLLDNEKQQIKARYERLKKKVSQIRSNLTPEQIAEIQNGCHERGGAPEGSRVELQSHDTRLATQRGRRISLELSGAALAGTSTPPVSPPSRARSAQQVIVAPSAIAMGHKRVRRLATAKPDLIANDDTSQRPPLAQASNSGKSAGNVPQTPRNQSRQIPHTPTSDVLCTVQEETKRDRAATVTCSSPRQDQPRLADILKRQRASTASGRLQITRNPSPKVPIDKEQLRRAMTPGTTVAPSSPPISPAEHQLSSSVPNYRFGLRKVSIVGSPVVRPRASCTVNAMGNVNSATVEKFYQWPVASTAEPPAAFSCHEPKLEDALSRSPSTKNPSRRLSAVAVVSPFQESRARKREELREARIDDNEQLAIEFEQRKERLLKGIEGIVGRPHEDENNGAPKCDTDNKSDPLLPPKPSEKNGKRGHVDPNNKKGIKGQGSSFDWRKDMMKIRYLRLPKNSEEVVTDDMLTMATAQHKATTKWRKFVRK